jgi:hypothetical protein
VSNKTSNDLIGNRTADLPAYTVVSQQTTLPRVPYVMQLIDIILYLPITFFCWLIREDASLNNASFSIKMDMLT